LAGTPNHAANLCPHHHSVLATILQFIFFLPGIFFALIDHLI